MKSDDQTSVHSLRKIIIYQSSVPPVKTKKKLIDIATWSLHWKINKQIKTKRGNANTTSWWEIRVKQAPWPCYMFPVVSFPDWHPQPKQSLLKELAVLWPLPRGSSCAKWALPDYTHSPAATMTGGRAQQGRHLSLKEGRNVTLPLWIEVVVLTISLESLILWSTSYYAKADVQSGTFSKFILKSTRYSASAPPWKFLSLSLSAWLAALKSRQLSRRWVGRKPSVVTEGLSARFSVCRAHQVSPDSCAYFTQAKQSTGEAAASLCLTELHSGQGAKSGASLHSICEGRCKSSCRCYCFAQGESSTMFANCFTNFHSLSCHFGS